MTPARLRAVPTGPLDAVALIRVSKVGARGDDLISPELQREAIQGYADSRSMRITEWIEALDESGSKSGSRWWGRLEQAVSMVEAGTVQAVLVWKFSRAARSRKHWAVALDRVEVAGGVLESATEQLDTSTSTGRLARGMLAELAAWEADIRGEGWRETQAHRIAQGQPHTPTARFGYTYDRTAKRYDIDPTSGPVVAEMFARYVAGEGAMAVARWANSRGLQGPRGGVWCTSSVIRLLDSGFAAGRLRRHGELLPGAQPRIVDEPTWQAYLAQRRRTARTPVKIRAPRSALSGLLHCGTCGAPMSAYPRPDRRGQPVRMFRCRADTDTPGVCGRAAHVTEGRALRAVFDWLQAQAADPAVKDQADALRKITAASVKAERRQLAAEHDRASKALARLAVREAMRDMPTDVYAAARDELLGARELAADRLARLAEDTRSLSRPVPGRARTLLGAWDSMDNTGRRQALEQLVRQIVVEPGRKDGRGASVSVTALWDD